VAVTEVAAAAAAIAAAAEAIAATAADHAGKRRAPKPASSASMARRAQASALHDASSGLKSVHPRRDARSGIRGGCSKAVESAGSHRRR
jgi:hypothetical protein